MSPNPSHLSRLSTAAFRMAFIFLLWHTTNRALAQTWTPNTLPAGLISWWNADGTTGDVMGLNSGIVEGNVTYEPGKFGQAFRFHGPQDSIVAPDSASLDLSGPFTLEAWIKLASASNDPRGPGRAIFSKVGGSGGNNGYQFGLSLAPGSSSLGGNFNSPGQSWNSAYGVSATFTPALPLGEWLHVAFTYDNERQMIYLNGKAVATNNIGSRPIVNSSSTFRISGDDNHNVYFDGWIDEARIYGRALAAQEIAAIAGALLFMGVDAPPACVAWLSGDGHTLDLTAKHNDGTPGSAVTYAPGKVGSGMRFIESPDSFVELADSPLFQPANNTLTIEAWVKPDFSITGPEGVDTILIKRDNCDMTFPYNFCVLKGALGKVGNLAFAALPVVPYPAIISTETVPNDGRFHHVAVTFNGNKSSGNCILFIDGQKAGGGDAPGVLPLSAAPAVIGRHAGCGHYSSMVLDELAFYNRELSETEIQAIYLADDMGKKKNLAILAQPKSQAIGIGGQGLLSVAASGEGVLGYQWYKDQELLAGSASASLILTNVQLPSQGRYQVVVTNMSGSVTSQVAVLTVSGGTKTDTRTLWFSLADDWSDTRNPNGVWSLYKSETALFTVNQQDFNGNGTRIRAWADGPSPQNKFVPVWGHTDGDPVWLHTAEFDRTGANVTKARWTSPSGGFITIRGGVWMNAHHGRRVGWELRLNNRTITGGEISDGDPYDLNKPFRFDAGSGGPTVTTAQVALGDTVELALISISDNGNTGESMGVDFGVELRLPFSDAFTGSLNPAYWMIQSNQPLYSVDFSNNQVRFSKPAGGSYLFQYIGLSYMPSLRGDFDVRVDFRDASIDRHDGSPGNQIQLNVATATQGFCVVRSDEGGHNHHVWDGAVHGAQPNSALQGTLRVVRVGKHITAYVGDTNIFDEDFNTADALININLQNNGTRDATSVVFDNFSVVADHILPATLPDLAVVQATAPNRALAGQPLPFSWVLTNRGTLTVSVPTLTRIALAEDVVGNGAIAIGDFTTSILLAPGESLSQTGMVAIPSELAGARWLVVMPDYSAELVETDEDNNRFVAPAPVQVLAPDLEVPQLRAAASTRLGEPLQVVWTVANRGTSPAGGLWSDRVYLGTDKYSLDGAQVLATVPAPATLTAGASYTNTVSVIVPLRPDLTPGNYYLLVVANNTGAQPESAIDNNLLGVPLALTLPPLPDLAVNDIRAPSQMAPGQAASVTWFVTNQGPASAWGEWSETLMVSNVVDDLQPLATFAFNNTLAAGGFLERTQAVTLPVNGMAGDLRFYVQIDSGRQWVEANSSNNLGAAANVTHVPLLLTLQLAASQIAENAANPLLHATIWRNGARSTAQAVTLSSGDKTLIDVPANVTIASGDSSASFDIRILHDRLVRGPQSVVVHATADGFQGATGTVVVLDADFLRLNVLLSTNRIQEGRTVAATVTRDQAGTDALVVTLGSSDPERLRVPDQVVIPAGSNAVVCALLAAENSLVEPTLTYAVSATAEGYTNSPVSLQILDDDLPEVTLTLDKDIAGPAAGIGMMLGTLTRVPASPQALTVELTNSDPARLQMPAKVKIPPQQASVTFSIALADDTPGQATAMETVGGYILASSSDARVAEIAPAQLLVTGSQGPALTLSSSLKIVKSGQKSAAVLTLARSAPATNSLLVHFSADNSARIKTPLDVTIPAGQTSLGVNLETLPGPVSGGSQKAKITAAAAGYGPGVETVWVADRDLADLAVTAVTAPLRAETEGYATVTYRVANQGYGTANSPFLTRVLLSKNALVGDATLLGQYRYVGSMPAGQFFEQTLQVRMPQIAGSYWIVVQTDTENMLDEYRKENNSAIGEKPIVVEASYGAHVYAAVRSALTGASVPLLGKATNNAGQGAAFKTVNIHILVRGCERILSAITDRDGNFEAVFQPLPGEAGFYQIFATHPGVSQGDVQDSFTLMGLGIHPSTASLSMVEQSTADAVVDVVNLGDNALTGLTATILSKPAEMQAKASLSGTTVNGRCSVKLKCAFVSGAPASGGNVVVRVDSAEGAGGQVAFGIVVESLRPKLSANPGEIYAGVVRGSQATVEFDVINTGGTHSEPVALSLPVLSWVQLVSTNPMPSLAPGETNRVILALTPAADTPLADFSGNLILQSSDAGVSVPFVFRTLSEAKGNLRVTAVDEYTYYAAGAPNLAGAAVVVKDAYGQNIVASGITGASGQFLTDPMPEGFYAVEVRAEKHNSYLGNILLLAGKTNEVQAFLSRQAVQFIWSVTPIQVEDRYQIKLETVFETSVPMPVVTVEPNVIDMQDFAQDVTQVEIKVTNHGLIAAQHSSLYFPEHPNYRFTPLISDIGLLAAKSSLTIPVRIERVQNAGKLALMKTGRTLAQSKKEDCTLDWTFTYCYPCGTNMQCVNLPFPAINLDGDCFPKPSESTPGESVALPYRTPTGSSSLPYIPGIPGTVSVSQPPTSRETPNDCAGCYLVGLANCAAGCVPGVGTAYGVVFAAMNPSRINQFGALVGAIPGYGCPAGCLLALCGCPQFTYNPCTNDWFNTVPQPYDFWGISGFVSGLVVGGAKSGNVPRAMAMAQISLKDKLDAYGEGMFAMQGLVKYILEDDQDRWLAGYKDPLIAALLGRFGEFTQTESADGAALAVEEQHALRSMDRPSSLSQEEVDRFLARWNRTCQYWTDGIMEIKDVPAGADTNFLTASGLTACLAPIKTSIEFCQQQGYDDPFTAFYGTLTDIVKLASGRGGVCAKVRLRIDQNAVISRDAFQARLEIVNAADFGLSKVKVQIVVRDANGVDAAGRFSVGVPRLSALNAVDGTGEVAPNTTGLAEWTLIPTQDAAPEGEMRYLIGGTVDYEQEGLQVSVPLEATGIAVLPLPRLRVQYFHERDVFSDDPFTEIVESSVPFNLAVMIHNAGKGVARNFRLSSAQPKIVENEKGLLIDFKIIGTEVSGQSQTPSLTASFGDLGPGTNVTGRWLLTSTLQGLFTDYQASFEHVDGLGNARASLIEKLSIHELIHVVQAPGAFEDGRPDFLVNDIGDIWALPDTLYMSDGTTNPVRVVQQAAIDAAPSSARLQCGLAASMPSGWACLRVSEPGNGKYRLIRVERSDGVPISLNTNVWTTDRTFTGLGKPPIRENILHLLDYNSPGSYMLYYALLPEADAIAPSSAMAALSANSYAQFPLSWHGEDNAGGSGLAFFDIFVSSDGGPFKPWLQRTTLRGAVYSGAAEARYAFYSVATDNAGNRESSSAPVETTTSLINHPPVLSPPIDVSLDLGETLTVTQQATDADLPAQRLAYRLDSGAPASAYINPDTGTIVWRTAEGGKPGTRTFSVIVTDSGAPPLSATGLVNVVIRAVNTPPALDPIPDWTVSEGSLLTFTNTAWDADYPPNNLTFSLGAGAPQRASIDASSGVFRWLPVATDAPGTNRIAIVATDDGTPPMSASREFTVIVREVSSYFDIAAGSTNLLSGESAMVPLQLSSRAPLKEISFVINVDPVGLVNLSLQPLAPQLESVAVAADRPGRWIAQAKARSGQTLTGQFTLANLSFQAVSNRISFVASLGLNELQGATDDGLALTKALGYGGRVFVVGDRPILDASLNSSQECQLVVYGQPDRTYRVQYAGSLKQPVTWKFLLDAPMNGQSFRVLNLGAADLPEVYFLAY